MALLWHHEPASRPLVGCCCSGPQQDAASSSPALLMLASRHRRLSAVGCGSRRGWCSRIPSGPRFSLNDVCQGDGQNCQSLWERWADRRTRSPRGRSSVSPGGAPGRPVCLVRVADEAAIWVWARPRSHRLESAKRQARHHRALSRTLAPLIGRRAFDTEWIGRRRSAAFGHSFAKAALELACWICRADSRVPVYKLLGGRDTHRPRVIPASALKLWGAVSPPGSLTGTADGRRAGRYQVKVAATES